MRRLLVALLVLAPALGAQEPPNRDYQPPFKGEAVFDPRPAKRAAAAAEAARREAEAKAAIEAAAVPVDSPPPAAAEPQLPAPAPMPTAEGYVPPADIAGHAGAAPPEEVRGPIRTPVENPRPFGYLVGDVLVQKLRLSVDGQPVELAELPRRDRFGVWIARRASHIETRADGWRWLVMEYQIINASKDVDVIALPKLKLRTTTEELFIEVPDWPITVGAITASQVRNQGGLLALQPDRPAPTIATEAIRHRLQQAWTALALLLAGWFGWWRWREWRASQQQPFARALHRLRGLEPDSEGAWRTLHQAFDATAGRVIQPASLAWLFRSAPQLEPARAAIERWYAESAARFFGGAGRAPSLTPLALCAQLRGIEKRHET